MYEFQKILLKYRIKKNQSLKMLSMRIGISENALYNLENKDIFSQTVNPITQANFLKKYSDYLGIPENKQEYMLFEINKLNIKEENKTTYTVFDFFNKFIIIILILSIGYFGYEYYLEKSILLQKENSSLMNNQDKTQFKTQIVIENKKNILPVKAKKEKVKNIEKSNLKIVNNEDDNLIITSNIPNETNINIENNIKNPNIVADVVETINLETKSESAIDILNSKDDSIANNVEPVISEKLETINNDEKKALDILNSDNNFSSNDDVEKDSNNAFYILNETNINRDEPSESKAIEKNKVVEIINTDFALDILNDIDDETSIDYDDNLSETLPSDDDNANVENQNENSSFSIDDYLNSFRK